MQLFHQVLYVLLQPFDRQRFLCRSCVELVPERPYDFHELDFRTLDEALNLPLITSCATRSSCRVSSTCGVHRFTCGSRPVDVSAMTWSLASIGGRVSIGGRCASESAVGLDRAVDPLLCPRRLFPIAQPRFRPTPGFATM